MRYVIGSVCILMLAAICVTVARTQIEDGPKLAPNPTKPPKLLFRVLESARLEEALPASAPSQDVVQEQHKPTEEQIKNALELAAGLLR